MVKMVDDTLPYHFGSIISIYFSYDNIKKNEQNRYVSANQAKTYIYKDKEVFLGRFTYIS